MSRDLTLLGQLFFFYLLLVDCARSEQVLVDPAKGCGLMHCARGEHCVNRKFWCKTPPCPSMIYCSKTPTESLKGPMTCASVRCSRGYVCLVRARRCRWDQKCEQQIARCVSEREYYDGPASCGDFHCPSGEQCILKEPMCAFPPCKLLKSCANTNDVHVWHSRCRTLGCPSKYECFLRRPPDHCSSTNSCKHTPDCTITNVREVTVNPDCQGWVCPPHQECSALVTESCSPDNGVGNCTINRTCQGPMATFEATSPSFPRMLTTVTSNIQDDTSSMKNSSYHFGHPTKRTSASVPVSRYAPIASATDYNLNQSTVRENCTMHLVKWNLQNGSIYRTPIYVRSPVNRNISRVRNSLGGARPTDNSTMKWLDYLRLKTGVDAINEWVNQAEENSNYEQFNEWLTAVRTSLGPFQFGIWITEIEELTSEYPAFRKWLASSKEVSLVRDNETDVGNVTEQTSLSEYPDHGPNSQMDNERVYETAEKPLHGNETSTRINSPEKPGNDHPVFSVDQERPKILQRKSAEDHPTINYGQNRGYNEHRDFSPPKLKNEMVTWYFTNDPSGDLQTKKHDLDRREKTVESGPSQNDRVNPPLHLDHKIGENRPGLDHSKVKLSNRGNNSAMYDSTRESPVDSVVEEQKNILNDSRPQDGIQLRNLQDPIVGLLARMQEKQEMQDLTKKNDSTGFETLGPNIGQDQISNRSSHDSNVLFDKVENPEKNFDPQRSTVSTDPRQFTEEDQKESRPTSKSPESMQYQWNELAHASDPKLLNTLTRSRDTLSDIGMKQEKTRTETYALFTPTADELHIISPWDAVRILDPEKKTYYTLVKFPAKQANNQMRIMGYPLVVSRVPPIDRPSILLRNAKNLDNISLNSESPGEQETTEPPNPWQQISQHQQILRRLVPPLVQKSELFSITEKEQIVEVSTPPAEPQSNSQEQNNQRAPIDMQKPDHQISTLFQNRYLWNGGAPHDVSEVNRDSRLSLNPHPAEGIADLEKNLREYHDTLNSEEYITAYVDTIIEDALSKVILNWTNSLSENPGPLSQDLITAARDRIGEEYLNSDHKNEAEISEKDTSKNTVKQAGSPNIFYSSESDWSMKDDLSDGGRMTSTPTPNLSTDSMITEIDHQYECDSPQTMEIKGKSLTIEASDEDEDYYSEDAEHQEYYERSFGNQDEYRTDLETNSSNSQLQYYHDGRLRRGREGCPNI